MRTRVTDDGTLRGERAPKFRECDKTQRDAVENKVCVESPRRARGYKQYNPVTAATAARTTITSGDGMVIRSGGNMLPQARTMMLLYGLLVYLCVGFTHASFAAVFESTPPSSSYGNDHGGDFKYLFLPYLLLSFSFSLPHLSSVSHHAVPCPTFVIYLVRATSVQADRVRVYMRTYADLTASSHIACIEAVCFFRHRDRWRGGNCDGTSQVRPDGRFVAPAARRNCYGVSIRSCMPVFRRLSRLHGMTSVVERGRTAPNPVDTPPTPPPPPCETGEEKERRLLTLCRRRECFFFHLRNENARNFKYGRGLRKMRGSPSGGSKRALARPFGSVDVLRRVLQGLWRDVMKKLSGRWTYSE